MSLITQGHLRVHGVCPAIGKNDLDQRRRFPLGFSKARNKLVDVWDRDIQAKMVSTFYVLLNKAFLGVLWGAGKGLTGTGVFTWDVQRAQLVLSSTLPAGPSDLCYHGQHAYSIWLLYKLNEIIPRAQGVTPVTVPLNTILHRRLKTEPLTYSTRDHSRG